MTIPMTIADTMWKAMAQAVPEWIAAGHHADLVPGFAAPLDPKTKRPMNLGGGGGGVAGGLAGGGFGAKYNEDGMSATVCLNDGDTHNNPIEAGEAKNRVAMILRKELRTDSGGPGKFRGGLGVVAEVVYFTDAQLNSYIERSICPPWGALGAKPGLANALRVAVPKEKVEYDKAWDPRTLSIALDVEEYPNQSRRDAKVSKFLPVCSRTTIMTGGGGGFGNPLERDPAKVLDDVFNGYVSLESARRDYGVAINTADWTVDRAATQSLRSKKD
jgi:N-methylhydantoinase B